jgi:hypothetical protein
VASVTAPSDPASSVTTSYPGVYAARVYSTSDPAHTGRIQMLIPQIFGVAPVKIWAPPLSAGGGVPNVGDMVWCIFQGGDQSYPTYLPPAPSPPIGGLVGSMVGPAVSTNYPSGLTNILSGSMQLAQGCTYAVTLTCIQAQQVTAASPTAVQIYARDSSQYIPNATGLKTFLAAPLALGAYITGSQAIPIFATATVTDTFTVTVETGANSLNISPSAVSLMVVRTS